MQTATAIAFPNIAFIKYWGNLDDELRLAANSSISMNLGGLHTRTRVVFDPALASDMLILDGQPAGEAAVQRVSAFLDIVRQQAGLKWFGRVESENNFPTGAGVASSASAFAALALAASTAAGLDLDQEALSRLARRGSGSASRSVPAGFVEWVACPDDACSYAVSIAPPEHWDLHDCIAVVSQEGKATGSSEGHSLAAASPLQAVRLAGAPERLDRCREAILQRDFEALAEVAELDSNLMHAVMLTGSPPLIYWQPATLAVMHAVVDWRNAGLPVFYTIDAGPNVHVLCRAKDADQVSDRLAGLPGVLRVLRAYPGGPARLIDTESS